MSLFFLSCFLLGSVVLVLQLAASASGVDHGLDADHDMGHHGLDLLSVRALAAGVGFFGLAGLGLTRSGLGAVVAIAGALFAGAGAAYGVARMMRGLRRLEVDKSFDIASAIGLPGRVHLGIPSSRNGAGKVHVVVHDRLMELDAVTAGAEIETGNEVFVTDVVSSDTVVVSRVNPLLGEPSDAP